MSRLALANLALLAAVAALAAFVFLQPTRDSASGLAIATLSPGDAARIRIEREGEPAIVIERHGLGWRVVEPLAAAADPYQIERLLALLTARSLQRLTATGLERYGLDRPRARIAIDGERFAFGIVNDVSGEQYVLAGDAVHAIAPQYGSALPVDAMQLARKQLLSASEAPLRFDAGEFIVEQKEGMWRVEPARGDASQDDLNRWVENWRLATALRVAPFEPRPALSEIRIGLKTGGTIGLAILRREPDLVIARPDEKLQYHFPAAAAKRLLAAPKSDKPASGER